MNTLVIKYDRFTLSIWDANRGTSLYRVHKKYLQHNLDTEYRVERLFRDLGVKTWANMGILLAFYNAIKKEYPQCPGSTEWIASILHPYFIYRTIK